MNAVKQSGFSGVWPVVQRELREGARRPFNHWLRIGSAAAGLAVLYFDLAAFYGNLPTSMIGQGLFSSLHTLLLLLICCVIPLMTADCIAREKREGTLGLLFLTGLTPAGIVIGKSAVQALRAFTLWLAVLPVLTIPFLSGGVTWSQAVSAIALEFCAAVLCLAAGLLASTMAKKRASAFALALGFAMTFMMFFGGTMSFHFASSSYLSGAYLPRGPAVPPWAGRYPPSGYYLSPSGQTIRMFQNPASRSFRYQMSTGNVVRTWGRGGIFGATSGLPLRIQALILIQMVGAAVLVLMLVLALAARRIQQSWQDKIPTVRGGHLIRRYCTPVLQAAFARRMHRALDRNPVAWLQQYSWRARTAKWGLCLFFVVLECWMMDGSSLPGILVTQVTLVMILAAVFTFSGVNSFLEEKKSGALELMLITPLSVNQIIFGRVFGLWMQFLPGAVVIAGFYIAATNAVIDYQGTYYEYGQQFLSLWFVLNGYLILPFLSTYFALRVKNLIVAAVLTWIALILAPIVGLVVFDQACWGLGLTLTTNLIFAAVLFGNISFALLMCFLLRHSLARRIYSF